MSLVFYRMMCLSKYSPRIQSNSEKGHLKVFFLARVFNMDVLIAFQSVRTENAFLGFYKSNITVSNKLALRLYVVL